MEVIKKTSCKFKYSYQNVDSEVLISKLTKTVISSGSACSSRELEPSSVLKGMGLKDNIIKSALKLVLEDFLQKRCSFYG